MYLSPDMRAHPARCWLHTKNVALIPFHVCFACEIVRDLGFQELLFYTSVSIWLKSTSINRSVLTELFAEALTGVQYSPVPTYLTELVASVVPRDPCLPEAFEVVLTLPVSVGTAVACTCTVLV
jgi:hypothetical protein